MLRDNESTEITLTRANAALAAEIAAILKKPVEEIVFICLKGSTNLATR